MRQGDEVVRMNSHQGSKEVIRGARAFPRGNSQATAAPTDNECRLKNEELRLRKVQYTE